MEGYQQKTKMSMQQLKRTQWGGGRTAAGHADNCSEDMSHWSRRSHADEPTRPAGSKPALRLIPYLLICYQICSIYY